MDALFSIDWRALFIPEHSILDMVVRGTIMYLGIFAVLRMLGRRQGGSIGTADILVIVLLADAAQNGMTHEYKSVTEGMVLVLTILAWNQVLDWLSYHVPKLRPLLAAPALCLIKNGTLQRRNMRIEMITPEELLSQLREQGVESPADVKTTMLEEDGRISVIKKKGR